MSGEARARGSFLDRLLAPFADVRAGEGVTALLLMLNVFLLLTAYYLVKTAREPLILAGGGAEVKSYAAAGMAALLLFAVPAYGRFASRVNRVQLVTWVTLFFAANLAVFYALALARTPFLGVAFFLWVGIFNMMIVAQFWAYANDVYTKEQGERLFAIVGFGATSGAIFGAWLAKQLIGAVGVYPLMLVGAALLLGCIALTHAVNAREARVPDGRPAESPLAPGGGFGLVFADRYLLLIALLMLALNFVNTNGEYILGKTVTIEAARRVAAGAAGAGDAGEWTQRFIGGFYADYFAWVNVVAALAQAFLVSRVIRLAGVRGALFVLPAIALGGYGLLAFAPLLAVVRVAKVAENAVDYSLQNTARHALFLPTSREAKYKAKAAIDSFFVRGGDLLSSGLVFAATQLQWGPRQLAGVNLVLVFAWIAVVVALGREHRRLAAKT